MEVFLVDIGKGTQDLLYADERTNTENWVKAILPSPTVKLARKVASFNGDLFVDGYVMGGGPVKRALVQHIKKGYRVVVSERVARTIKDDLEKVKSLGIDIVEKIDRPNLFLSDLEFELYEELLRLAG